jgi:hypothetical protein
LFHKCFVLLALSFISLITVASASAQTSITCSSNDGRRNYCAVDTRGGVQMVRQRSGSACTQGSTWGYDRRGIWVDRGCRADFVVGRGGSGGNYGPGRSTITCSSDDGRRHYCNADTRGGVALLNQRSGSPCTQGYSWGYDQRGVWVDRGCRADFAIGRGGSRGNYRPGGSTITCSSDDGRRHYCDADTRGGVALLNQRSGSPCTQGYSWGYDQRGVWVDRGCRADFAIGGGRQGGGNYRPPVSGGTITCSSDDGRRHYCNADTRGGVTLLNQRSGSPCSQGSTWGYDQRGIWVDRGCRADFRLGR